MKTAIDSYVFIDVFLHSRKEETAVKKLQGASASDSVISSMVIAEVKYQIIKKLGHEKAEEAVFTIKNIEGMKIVDVSSEIAETAADIRAKYYKKNDNELSYADAIHIATAKLTGCDTLITGDPDFKEITEIKIDFY